MFSTPTEIHELIISQLDAKADLLACALVCSAWVPRSRSRIFSNPIPILRHDWLSAKAQDISIPALLRSQYSSLRQHLTSIIIYASKAALADPDWRKTCTALAESGVELRNLHVIWPNTSQDHTPFPHLSLPLHRLISTSCRTLESAEFRNCHAYDAPGLCAAIAQCERVKTFSICPENETGPVRFTEIGYAPKSLTRLSVSLFNEQLVSYLSHCAIEELSVEVWQSEEVQCLEQYLQRLTQWHTRSILVPCLIIGHDGFDSRMIPAVSQLLQSYGHLIQKLLLNVCHDSRVELNLERMVNLSLLSCQIRFFDTDEMMDRALNSLFSSLLTLPATSEHAHSLSTELVVELQNRPTDMDLEKLDRTLDHWTTGYSSVRRINVGIKTSAQMEGGGASGVSGAKFPRCSLRSSGDARFGFEVKQVTLYQTTLTGSFWY